MLTYEPTKINLKGQDMTPVRILIKFAHGLGDVVQATVILKHLRKYRPDWIVDFRCGIGKHTAAIGLCNRVFHDKEPEPNPVVPYKTVVDPGFWENYSKEIGVPNSKVVNCLKEVFGLDYDPDLGRYEVQVPNDSMHRADAYLESVGAKKLDPTNFGTHHWNAAFVRRGAVLIHYQGNTSPHKKNLAQWQAKSLCDMVLRSGRVPIILDWDRRSTLPDGIKIFNPPTGGGDIWGGHGTGDAATIAALISLSEAFIGVDSGPGKVASSTETPSLIIWTGHHPIQFHDPAPNTTHLIPENHRELSPLRERPEIGEYFSKAYLSRAYKDGAHGLVLEACRWLGDVLGCKAEVPAAVQYVTPNGIGDVVWVLHKIREIAAKEHAGAPIDILLSGNPGNEIDKRCVPFLKRFPFVRAAQVLDVPVLVDRDNPSDAQGRYRYEPDGVRGCHHFLCANAALERGQRLEEWMPQYRTDWDVIKEFDWSGTEAGTKKGQELGKFVAFYLGPETGNVDEGHARGFAWEPAQWIQLAAWFISKSCKIAVVGASYDRSYWERYVRGGVQEHGQPWADLIGQFEIGETFALLKEAKALISYQCGLGIVGCLMGVNVAMWWRPDGDSIHPNRLVSFDERMKDAWVNPALKDNYIGLIYKRETVQDLIEIIDKKGWVQG